jgi:hypothetical protein
MFAEGNQIKVLVADDNREFVAYCATILATIQISN